MKDYLIIIPLVVLLAFPIVGPRIARMHVGKTFIVNANGELKRLRKRDSLYQKCQDKQYFGKDYDLFYPADSSGKIDSVKLIHYMALLVEKIDKRRKFIKGYTLVITSDSTAEFKLNTGRWRDRSAHCTINTITRHIHYSEANW